VKLNLKTPKTPEGKLLLALIDGMKSPLEGMQQGTEANAHEFGVSIGSRDRGPLASGFWGCTDYLLWL
jgi:hypothetical protein